MNLGHKIVGKGEVNVIVMHDWFCDRSTYEAIIPYLDENQFTYAFVDLRGYGESRNLQGKYSLGEAYWDLLDCADQLKWSRFHIVGHSMSAMVAQWAALEAQDRIESVVAVTPVSAAGAPIPLDIYEYLKAASTTDTTIASDVIHMMTGKRHTQNFISYKVKKWWETSTPSARLGYLDMFTKTDFSDKVKGLQTPIRVLVGDHDIETYSEPHIKDTFLQWYPNATCRVIKNSGHYPMQEVPVAFVGELEAALSVDK